MVRPRTTSAVSKRARTFILLTLMATTVGCDRVTKRIAMTSLAGAPERSFMRDTVRLEYAENSGGFLSVGANLKPSTRTATFTLGSMFILIALLIAGLKFHSTTWHICGISLALSGGASNLVDRMMRGSVVDFV